MVVFFAGIHGNETAGVKAVEQVFGEADHGGGSGSPDGGAGEDAETRGKGSRAGGGWAYVVFGNLKALDKGVRFIDTDLNRMWEETGEPILRPGEEGEGSGEGGEGAPRPAELEEFASVRDAIGRILADHAEKSRRIVFADLHTTSSKSCGFILINDTLENRRIASRFPVPQILGIEEAIHGTVLSYINNLGHAALGFEAGAHDDPGSVGRSEAFVRLLLDEAGVDPPMPDSRRRTLRAALRAGLQTELRPELQIGGRKRAPVPGGYYAIRHHHVLREGVAFRMEPGFLNFDPVRKGQLLALEEGVPIAAPRSARIFMPLYQEKGRDGFLLVKRVARFWLELSKVLRGAWVHRVMGRLPGVREISPTGVEVDLRVARFLVEPLFHLTGYRVLRKSPVTLVCYRR